ATPLTGFVQREPYDGRPSSEETVVRVLFDDEALYVGVWLFDREPSAIVDGEAIRDANLNESDAVEIILDTFRDEQNGFVFGTNPAGVEYDGQVANEGQGGGRFGGGSSKGSSGAVIGVLLGQVNLGERAGPRQPHTAASAPSMRERS
ncbi:MAG: hypothetical protein KY453_00485, partial [Gemmatimonadetes bacterium]|nr:hypothetical protein [Gemmatimonadota bacterium]